MAENNKPVQPPMVHAIKVRLDDDELQLVRVAAALHGVRSSEYIRLKVLESAKATIGNGIGKMELA